MRMAAMTRTIFMPARVCASILAADDDHGEGAGDDGWTRARVLRGRIGARTEFGSDEIDAVGAGVVGHGARAGLGSEALDGGIAGSGGVDHGENAVAA